MKKRYYWIVLVAIAVLISIFICNLILFRNPPAYTNEWSVGVCPSIKQIDCMPIVKPEFEIYCRPENREWIQENCPNIKFFD